MLFDRKYFIIGTITGLDSSFDALMNSSLGYLIYIAMMGFIINSIMAAINMLPWGIFDGSKVFDWSKMIWGVIAAIAFVMALFTIILMM